MTNQATNLKYLYTSVVFQEVPDEISLAIEITGCPHGCPGCHSPELQFDAGTPLTQEELDRLIAPHAQWITCVCFMGGDQHPTQLLALAYRVKALGYKTALYSGSDVKVHLERQFIQVFDYIKWGRYIAARGGLSTPGTNQYFFKRVHTDSDTYGLIDITYRFQGGNQ